MKPFSEQLSEFVQRAGISDAELARRLGVSRQTIFRWREGATQSPRHRPDVVRLAEALRLTPQERDQFLLAAGFHPEGHGSADVSDQPHPPEAGQGSDVVGSSAPEPASRTGYRLRRWWVLAAIAALGLSILIATGGWKEAGRLLGLELSGDPQAAAPGETLVLVAEFANYSGGGIGFNVQDRLAEALQAEFAEAGLEATRVEQLDQSFDSGDQAAQAAARLGAEFALWGEYDSGRVIAFLTGPGPSESSLADEQRWLISSLEQLSVTINVELPKEVQWMGLYGVGLAHFRAQRDAQAAAALNRALQSAPSDPNALGGVYFTLGVIEGRSSDPDLDRVIALYTEALELVPGLVSAMNNRGSAYLARGAIGDLGRAEADFRRSMDLAPEFAPAPYNLALTISRKDAPDLDEILDLLEQAESLDADKAQLQNALCWFLSLADEPEQALSHCELAIELDDSGYSNDSYGLALALSGRYEQAAEQFSLFLEKLEPADPAAYSTFEPIRREWSERLEAGENPFDSAALRALLEGEYVP